MKKFMRRAISTSSFLITPMMAGLAVLAHPLIQILLGEAWLPCVPFVQACCFTYAFYPIHTTNLTAINAVGRSDLFLKLEIIKSSYGLAILIVFFLYFRTPIGIAYGAMCSAVISSVVNAFPNKKQIDYGYLEQIRDIMPSIVLSAFMVLGMHLFAKITMPLILSFVLQIILGIILYLGLAKIFHVESLNYAIKTLKELKKR